MIRDTLATFTTHEISYAEIAEMITSRPGAFWVVQSDYIQGFATFGPFRKGPGYAATAEHTVILSAKAQGLGFGPALMMQLEGEAQTQGIHVLVAGISSANPGAVTFHRRLGFHQTDEMAQVGRKAGHWIDLILMQKIISAS